MNSSISQIAEQFGIKPGMVETGAGAVLNLVKEKISGDDFQKLLGSIPGAKDWVGKATASLAAAGETGGSAAGGLMGQLGGMLSSVTGGGGLGGLLSTLQQAGLKPETATQLVPALVNMIKSHVNPELFEKLLGSVPVLKDALSNSGAGVSGLIGGLSGMFNKS